MEQIRIQAERKAWSRKDVDKLKLFEYELENWKSLGDKNTTYLPSALVERTKLASELAVKGSRYCANQITVVLEPVLANSVTATLEHAIEFLDFIPEKVAASKLKPEKYNRKYLPDVPVSGHDS